MRSGCISWIKLQLFQRHNNPIKLKRQYANMTTSKLPHSEVSALTQNLHTEFQESLQQFAQSDETFKIVYSVYASTETPLKDVKSLYVLDSSFNPPTKAHLTLARNAILNDHGSKPARMMFLLATENADKKPKPAAFEDRLVMMSLMAGRIGDEFDDMPVDVAVTKKPFFMDKATSIDKAEIYGNAQQVHLTGYDTIVRIFNAKYYPNDLKLKVLEPFLSKHRLRVCYRLSGQEGSSEAENDRKEQDAYVEAIGDGSRADEGMKPEWRRAIELVDDAKEVRGVSSTNARKAAVEGDTETLRDLLGTDVAEYVLEQKLYNNAEDVVKHGIKPKA